MEKIMNVENEWHQMIKADMIEGPIEGATDEEMMEAMSKTKLGKTAGPELDLGRDFQIISG